MSNFATANRKVTNSSSPGPTDDHAAKAQPKFQQETGEGEDESEDEEGGGGAKSKKAVHRKIKIEYIEDKSRRHITFSKRKAGIMKKAYELSTLTGTQVLLLVVSETGLVYTFTTPKLQPLVTKPDGKNLIQACLNAPDAPATSEPATPHQRNAHQQPAYSDQVDPADPMYPEERTKYNTGGAPTYPPNMMYPPVYGSIQSNMPMNPQYVNSQPYGSGYVGQPLYGVSEGGYMPQSQGYPSGWGGGAAGGKFHGQEADRK